MTQIPRRAALQSNLPLYRRINARRTDGGDHHDCRNPDGDDVLEVVICLTASFIIDPVFRSVEPVCLVEIHLQAEVRGVPSFELH